MKKDLRIGIVTLLTVFMTMGGTLTSHAAQWVFDGPENWKWKYQEDNGTWLVDSWKQVDGKWYHFDSNGYLDIGGHDFDGKYYMLSSQNENLGEMYQNVQLLTGSFGADGKWVDGEPITDTWRRWFDSKYNGANTWSAEDEASWQAQFDKYGITDTMFENYSSDTVGTMRQAQLVVSFEKFDGNRQDIINSIVMKLFMHTDGMGSVSYASWIGTEDGKNIILTIDYQMLG